jgi:DNA repair exonuclease SbcCD ATPase subunit
MIVTINNFRCYENKVINFEQFKLNLLFADSGHGKTTILKAIEWCLYGSMQHIYPLNDDAKKPSLKNQTYVSLYLPEYNNITIKRSKPPEVVEIIEENGVVYSSDYAEEYINRTFGSRNLWLSSTFINQGERNAFLSISNAEKFELLREITFGNLSLNDESPDFYIDKLNDELYIVKDKLIKDNAKYEVISELYQNDVAIHTKIIDEWEYDKTQETLDQFTESIKQHEDKLVILQDKYNKLKHEEIMFNNAKLRQNDLKTLLDNMLKNGKILDENDIIALETQIENNKKYIHECNEIDRMTKELNSLYFIQEHLNIDENERRSVLLDLKIKRETLDAALKKLNCHCHHEIRPICEKIINDNSIVSDEYEQWTVNTNKLKNNYNEEVQMCKQKFSMSLANYELIKQKNDLINNNNIYLKNKYKEAMITYNKYLKNKENISMLNDMNNSLLALDIKSKKEQFASMFDGMVLSVQSIDKLKLSAEILINKTLCPHCNNSIIFKNNTIIKGDHVVLEDINKASEDIVQLEKFRQYLNKYLELKKSIDIFSSNCIHDQEELTLPVQPIYEEVNIISKPEFKEPTKPNYPKEPTKPLNVSVYKKYLLIEDVPYTIIQINKELQSLDNKSKYIALKTAISQYDNFNLDVVTLKNENAKLTAILKNEINRQIEFKHITSELNKIVIDTTFDVSKISILENKILNIKNTINELIKDKANGEIVLKIFETKRQLLKIKRSIVTLTKKQNSLTVLKSIVDEVSSQSIESVIYSINTITNSILENLFDENIKILISSHRALKTKDKVKLQINIQVDYKGIMYDNINSLSGGEQDRLSFALTLSLSKILKSKILLLDECLSSLNSSLREKCIYILKNDFQNTTTVHICHEVVKGLHDSVVTI